MVDLSNYELELESLPQLSLQLFIIFKRADRFPTWLQWIQLGSSFIFAAKGCATSYAMWKYEVREEFIEKSLCDKMKEIGTAYNLVW